MIIGHGALRVGLESSGLAENWKQDIENLHFGSDYSDQGPSLYTGLLNKNQRRIWSFLLKSRTLLLGSYISVVLAKSVQNGRRVKRKNMSI